MAVGTKFKNAANKFLKPFNLKLDSLTIQKIEEDRQHRLRQKGFLDGEVYPVLAEMEQFDPEWIRSAAQQYRAELDDLLSVKSSENKRFNPDNGFFTGPDAEMLYLIARHFQPKNVLEIGSGNSTHVLRTAIEDGDWTPRHCAIDPYPRADIQTAVDNVTYSRVEEVPWQQLQDMVQSLQANDVLFIDSSHEVHGAGDLAVIFCRLLPLLAPGVLVHFHDIFLPYEYPEDFISAYPSWGEQYLLQTWLAAKPRKILWPGFYIQQSKPDLYGTLGLSGQSRAQSFWVRT